MNSWIYILSSIVGMQLFLAYYVFSKFALVRFFKIQGVGLKTLYVVSLFLAPLLTPIILLISLFGVLKRLFVKKKVDPVVPGGDSFDVDDFLKGFQ